MVHLISVKLILVHLFPVHIILVHTLWNFLKFFFHSSPITHGSPKVCEPVNHGSHVTHAPETFVKSHSRFEIKISTVFYEEFSYKC
jgi:hypothetical protein